MHVLAAFEFVVGYAATNVLTEMVCRNRDVAFRRAAVAFSTRSDRLLNAPGAIAAGITGVITAWALGYSFLQPWVIASIVLWIGLALVGAIYWGRVGRGVERALESGDQTTADRFFLDPRNVLVSRLENLVVIAIISLMVLRPSF